MIEKIWKRFQKEEGQSLLLAAVLLLFGGLAIVPMVNYTSTSIAVNESIEQKTHELYAAHNGIKQAMWDITIGGSAIAVGNSQTVPQFTSNDKLVDVDITRIDDLTYQLLSTAKGDEGSTSIESYVQLVRNYLFSHAIVALDGDITAQGDPDVYSDPIDPPEADIYANGDIKLTGQAYIGGDAAATGIIETGSGTVIEGDQEQGAAPIDFPEISPDPYLAEADAGGTINGNVLIEGSGTAYLGPVHITGDLTIKGSITVILLGSVYVDGATLVAGEAEVQGHHTIVTVGDVTVTGHSKLPWDEIPLFFSITGDAKVTGNNWTSALIYAPTGHVTFTGESMLYGSAVGMSASCEGQNQIEYPVPLRTDEDLPYSPKLLVCTYTID